MSKGEYVVRVGNSGDGVGGGRARFGPRVSPDAAARSEHGEERRPADPRFHPAAARPSYPRARYARPPEDLSVCSIRVSSAAVSFGITGPIFRHTIRPSRPIRTDVGSTVVRNTLATRPSASTAIG